jgi:heme/copper-type cytochrome/quinol oxidase subunit 2
MESNKLSLNREQCIDRIPIWKRLKVPVLTLMVTLLHFSSAHASMFKGETLDKVSDVLAWVVLIVAPIIGIVLFWLVHILPEKIAEKKHHPQAKAIQTLCLLSLVFGGMLWPIAWLWAYSKPVLYQQAYGTDKVAPDHDQADQDLPEEAETEEVIQLRERIAELESKLVAVKAATE